MNKMQLPVHSNQRDFKWIYQTLFEGTLKMVNFENDTFKPTLLIRFNNRYTMNPRPSNTTQLSSYVPKDKKSNNIFFVYIGVAFGVYRFKFSKMKILESVVYLFMGGFWIYVSQNVCLDVNDFLIFPNLYFGLN